MSDGNSETAESIDADRRRLRAAQGVLALLFLALAWIGSSPRYWPVVAWPVYRHVVPEPFADTIGRLEVRVIASSGARHALAATDLIEGSRADVVRAVLADAVAEEAAPGQGADRAWITHLVESAIRPDTPDRIEIWRIRWAVDAARLPPLDRESPVDSVRVAGFRPSTSR